MAETVVILGSVPSEFELMGHDRKDVPNCEHGQTANLILHLNLSYHA